MCVPMYVTGVYGAVYNLPVSDTTVAARMEPGPISQWHKKWNQGVFKNGSFRRPGHFPRYKQNPSLKIHLHLKDRCLSQIIDSYLMVSTIFPFLFFAVLSYLGIATAITCGGMVASSNLHSKLSHSIFRSPMSFFDTTPLGRILSRFSGDLDSVDQRIPFTAQSFVCGLLQLVSAAIVVVVSVPVCLSVIIPWVVLLVIIKVRLLDSSVTLLYT